MVRIRGPVGANPDLGRISYESPLARAILGREVGDVVELGSAGERGQVRIVAARRVRELADP